MRDQFSQFDDLTGKMSRGKASKGKRFEDSDDDLRILPKPLADFCLPLGRPHV